MRSATWMGFMLKISRGIGEVSSRSSSTACRMISRGAIFSLSAAGFSAETFHQHDEVQKQIRVEAGNHGELASR